MTVSDTLRTAADLIETRGHTVGGYTDDEGRLCAVGAIRVAVAPDVPPADPWRAPTLADDCAYREATRDLRRWVDRPGRTGLLQLGVTRWNDDRTAAEVIAGLRACADDNERPREETSR